MAGALNPTDKCLLHIPHKDFDMRGMEALVSVGIVEKDDPIKGLLNSLDDNFMSIEQWVDRFYKNCICDCAGGGT